MSPGGMLISMASEKMQENHKIQPYMLKLEKDNKTRSFPTQMSNLSQMRSMLGGGLQHLALKL